MNQREIRRMRRKKEREKEKIKYNRKKHPQNKAPTDNL